jgi:hypothetical protein
LYTSRRVSPVYNRQSSRWACAAAGKDPALNGAPGKVAHSYGSELLPRRGTPAMTKRDALPYPGDNARALTLIPESAQRSEEAEGWRGRQHCLDTGRDFDDHRYSPDSSRAGALTRSARR